MSKIEEEARAKLGLDTSDWEAKLKGAQTLTDNFFRRISNIATLGMGTIGLGSVIEFFNTVQQKAKSLSDMSANFEVSIDVLQGFQRQMRKAGWDTEYANDKLGKFMEQFGAAKSGDKAALDKFKALGIDLGTVSGRAMNADTAIRRMIEGINNIKDVHIRAKVFEDLFGRGSSEAAYALGGGIKEFEEKSKSILNLTTEETRALKTGKAAWSAMWNGAIDGASKLLAVIYTIGERTTKAGPYGMYNPSKTAPELQGPPIPQAYERTQDEIKKSNDLDNKLSEARDKRLKANEDSLKTEKRLFKEAEYLDRLSMNFEENSNAWKELQIDRENKLAEAEKLSIERQSKNVELRKQKADAEQSLFKSAESLAYQQTDRWHFTLEDVAGWKGGNRWRRASGMRARAVQQLEAASRNQAGMGYGYNADALMQRADYLRGTINALKSDERAPFADAAQSLNEISAKLDALEQKLTPARK